MVHAILLVRKLHDVIQILVVIEEILALVVEVSLGVDVQLNEVVEPDILAVVALAQQLEHLPCAVEHVNYVIIVDLDDFSDGNHELLGSYLDVRVLAQLGLQHCPLAQHVPRRADLAEHPLQPLQLETEEVPRQLVVVEGVEHVLAMLLAHQCLLDERRLQEGLSMRKQSPCLLRCEEHRLQFLLFH
jgi:hypothetical protein